MVFELIEHELNVKFFFLKPNFSVKNKIWELLQFGLQHIWRKKMKKNFLKVVPTFGVYL
ncbi:hypothetical protein LEP1GSC059_4431 [Leptospira noguchii serovar Panama str. CZ214]|uniref:Uncharacterized protein n=1 Tax=Leptospira noguchii serovar Panama str. CZ214 TaxID=1001595 RepID=T0GTH1_9LEPT|nr:hypothetical protein LEP1GSC059_4431 [Leptospira noguchii serovar Panama str. CZ214]